MSPFLSWSCSILAANILPMEETSSKKNPLIYFTGVLILSAVVTFFLIDKCSSSKNTAKQDDRSKISENLDSMNQLGNLEEGDEAIGATPEELIGKIREIVLDSQRSWQRPSLDRLSRQDQLHSSSGRATQQTRCQLRPQT